MTMKEQPISPSRRAESRKRPGIHAAEILPVPCTDASLGPLHSDGTATWPDVLESIGSDVQRHGSGTWRVPLDLVEATLDALIDHIFDRPCTRPDSLIAYALGICRNLRNHPPILALDRRRTSRLSPESDDSLADPRDDDSEEEIHLDWPIREVPADLSSFDLTPAQELVVRACQDASSWRVVAERTGMTRRDAKNRFRGAVKKIRRNPREFGPPPNKG